MKGFVRSVPNGPMTRFLILGMAIAWLTACDDELNNVGDEGACIAASEPCANADAPDAGVRGHLPGDGGTCTPPLDDMGNPAPCLPEPFGCQLYEGTVCDAPTSTCVCSPPPPPPPPPTCTPPLD